MRRARLTYKGAFHHIMSRGIKGEKIFFDDHAKNYFLKTLEERSKNLKIRVFAYCLMGNHYHLILQNSTGKLSAFMKQLNGQYGTYYRKRVGEKGYVFQDRFKSTLIQDDRYMRMAILYLLLNPVRSGIARNPWSYQWSSIREYFTNKKNSHIDREFVEELFSEKRVLRSLLEEWRVRDLPIQKTRMGDILGKEELLENALKKIDRREKKENSKRMRRYEVEIESAEKVVRDFEKQKGIIIEGIDTNSRKGRGLRDELLVLFKEKAGLTYSEIIQYAPFQGLKHSSLGQLYRRARKRKKEK